MPTITSGSTGHTVVVNRSRTNATIAKSTRAVAVQRRTIASTVIESQRAVAVSSAGPRGPQGLPGTDGSSTINRIASEILGGHRIVRSTGADTVGYADCTNASHGDDTQGMTLGAAIEGAAVVTQARGSITHAGWNWIPGDPVYLGANGLPTQTAPEPIDGAAFVQTIGHAEAATVLYLQIEPPTYFED